MKAPDFVHRLEPSHRQSHRQLYRTRDGIDDTGNNTTAPITVGRLPLNAAHCWRRQCRRSRKRSPTRPSALARTPLRLTAFTTTAPRDPGQRPGPRVRPPGCAGHGRIRPMTAYSGAIAVALRRNARGTGRPGRAPSKDSRKARGTGSGPSGPPGVRAKPLIPNGFPGRTPDVVRHASINTEKTRPRSHAWRAQCACHARQTVTHVPQAATLRQPQASRQARSGRCRSSAARARPLIPHGFQSQIMDADGCCRPDRPSGAVLHTPRTFGAGTTPHAVDITSLFPVNHAAPGRAMMVPVPRCNWNGRTDT